ncbi:hemin uptake protein HemP [bacterium]|jgi:hemin uptake protein HemP|nr:hemin uptake protein HemP [Planctomicrobium sp.]MDA7527961.1 hemin uptake protein HemP [bacterium]
MNSSEKQSDRDQPANQPPKLLSSGKEAVYDSEKLFGEHQEITICHNGECYRLRKTRTGKLILNK